MPIFPSTPLHSRVKNKIGISDPVIHLFIQQTFTAHLTHDQYRAGHQALF